VRELPPDTVVDQRYQIVSRIGSGGMADVYCAQDLQLGRKVALKLLHQRFADDAQFVERFRREAHSAANLQHSNVVGVYDRGEWDGTYYIAMEYLGGRSLKQVVQEAGALDPAYAIDLTLQILKAARFAHNRGVIHRDIKPHNVIVDDEGRAKVTDFGIARAGASDMTETGSIMGTAQYLSPEQAQGHAVGAASDLYAIGIVLYELLAGRVPFDGDQPVTVALKQVSEMPVPPSAYNPAVPPELDAVVLRAMEKDPAQRFASADEFIAALEHVRAQLAALPVGQSTAVWGAAPVPVPGAEDAEAAPPHDPNGEGAGIVYPPAPFPPEGEQPPPEEEEDRRRRRWPWILLALLLLAAIALGAMALGKFGLFAPDKTKLPNVVGTQLSAAATILENRGFKVETQSVISDQPKDRVLKQNPQPGTEVEKGSTVTLRVSGGPGNSIVPGVENLSRREAQRRVRAAGFKVQFSEEPSERVVSGRATRTTPPAGSQLEKNSTVTVFISTGAPQVSVPSVTGQNQDSATAELINAGLRVDVEQRDSERSAGTVLSQSPAAGVQVDKGSTVTITVARESREIPVPNTVGREEGAALSALNAAGFTPIVRTQPVTNQSQDGRVIFQSPSGGRAPRGSRVTITVGNFEEPGDDQPPQQPGE
jgi:eukaryotic-like serine/threonine-protein kinase